MKLAEVLKEADSLTASPRILIRLKEVLSDANSSPSDIVALLKVDSNLTGRVLAQSNSAYYSGSTSPRSLGEAINRLGFRQIYSVVAQAAAADFMAKNLSAYNLTADQMFEEALATATLMTQFGRRSSLIKEDEDMLYLIGLLHGIGKVIINNCLLRQGFGKSGYEKMPQLTPAREKSLYGFTYADAGSALLSNWQFSKDIVDAVRLHVEPFEKGYAPPMAFALCLSIRLKEKVMDSVNQVDFSWQGDPRLLSELNIQGGEIPDCVLEAISVYKKLSKLG
ncbi:MAG: HDOD domain-containing protein [Opitutales bacterium]|nr:HDOD domain-containing protein [Opitutales bacterium]